MDKKDTGAWIIHHSQKLQGVSLPTQDYEQIAFAGKCGIVLNALAASKEMDISNERLNALAKANGISPRMELPTILMELEKQRLIDRGEAAISVLGLTGNQTLEHTAKIFEESDPPECERVSLEVSEKVSEAPLPKKEVLEYVGDQFFLSAKETGEILGQCEEIGFFDSEEVSEGRLYFNGNLFRREDITKVNKVLSTLNANDERNVTTFLGKLKSSGCLPKPEALLTLGETLYSKLCAIGFIDENSILNEAGTFSFVTRPAAFCKFTNSASDDAFDLAKAFVTSLTYGMTHSAEGRGRINLIEALMRKLIAGQWIGPATAIGHDYKVLEMKGVVQLKAGNNGLYSMRLLKKEVGELALKVITDGEASSQSLLQLPSVAASEYEGPAKNRAIVRKNQPAPLKRVVGQLLSDLRTGGLR